MSRRPSPSASTANDRNARRHELRLPHRAGPRADHAARSMSPLCEDLQRRPQLGARPVPAPALEAQRGQRVDGRHVAGVAAVFAFHARDRHDGGLRHAVARGARRRARACVSASLRWPRCDAIGRHDHLDVVPRRARELGLRAVGRRRRAARSARRRTRCAAWRRRRRRPRADSTNARDPAREALLQRQLVGRHARRPAPPPAVTGAGCGVVDGGLAHAVSATAASVGDGVRTMGVGRNARHAGIVAVRKGRVQSAARPRKFHPRGRGRVACRPRASARA